MHPVLRCRLFWLSLAQDANQAPEDVPNPAAQKCCNNYDRTTYVQYVKTSVIAERVPSPHPIKPPVQQLIAKTSGQTRINDTECP